MAKVKTTDLFPALMRVNGSARPLGTVLADAIESGAPITLPAYTLPLEIEDASAIDPSLTIDQVSLHPPTPLPGTTYAGLSPAQRHSFITWSRKPEEPAPAAFQQIYLANLEARQFEATYRQSVLEKLQELVEAPTWAKNAALHRAYLLCCWLKQDGLLLSDWLDSHPIPTELLGIALGLQAIIGAPFTAREVGAAISTWQLGARLPTDLLKLRLDSLTAILGQPPLAHALAQLDANGLAPRPWRTSHRGLRLLIPQPDVRPFLEPSIRDLLRVADVDEDEAAPLGSLASLDTSQPATSAAEAEKPSLEELGWRLILEFSSNRSDYFDYVLIQAQKLAGYSQLMDEDRRIVYRILFRKSEMRRFWRIWDYVQGWTSTRVYLNGEELEKWKVWPYSQYLR